MDKRLKYRKMIYLFFLVLPLVYYLLYADGRVDEKDDESHPDYFYFSVASNTQGEIRFEGENGVVAMWQMEQGCCENLQYLGQIADDTLVFSFHHFASGDTVMLFSLNAYSHNKLYALYSFSDKDIVAENAQIAVKDGVLCIIPLEHDKPLVLKLKPVHMWDEAGNGSIIDVFVLILIIVFLILLFIFSPRIKPFVLSLVLALIFVLSCKLIITDKASRIEISGETMQGNKELFYNSTPFYNPEKKHVLQGKQKINIPLNLSVDKFLRFDPDEEIKNIEALNFKVKTDLFSFDVTPLSSPQNYVLNDIKTENSIYTVCGNDPYISFATVYFLNKLNNLITLERYLVLFIGLLLFFALLLVLHFIKFTDKIKFRWYYLSFLLLPLSYLIITLLWTQKKADEGDAQIYFSLRSPEAAVICLMNGQDTLAVWENNTKGYKYFHYKGKTACDKALYINLDGLDTGDTIALLSVNLFKNGVVYNLYDEEEEICHFTNTLSVEDEHSRSVIVENSQQPVIIGLMPLSALEKNEAKGYVYFVIVIIFLIFFIPVLLTYPSKPYFIAVCVTMGFFMFAYFWVSHHWQSHLIMKTSTPLKSVQFFYSNTPEFIHDIKNDINSDEPVFKTEIELFDNNFLRCDIVDSTINLENLSISLKTGIIIKSWDYNTIAPEQILLNDMLRVGNMFYISGNDPYIVLSSAEQWHSIRLLSYARQNIFVLLTLVIFGLLIFLNRFLNRYAVAEVVLVFAFIMSITYSFFFFLFTSESIILQAEMRYANTYPKYNKDSLDVYIEGAENYLNDRLPGRTNIIIMNNLIEFNIFKQIINNPNVHFGKDGWMFYIGGVCRENYENRNPLTDEELEKMTDVLLKRRDWLRKRGIQFYFMFPPMAYFVYEDEVGARLWRYHKKSKVEQLYEYVNRHTDLNFIDLQTPLKKARDMDSKLLFFKTNSHWNYNGSYIAYTTLVNYLKRDFPHIPEPFPYDSIRWVKYDKYIPDLYKALALDRYYTSIEYEPVRAYMLRHVETTYPIYEGFSSPAPAFCLINETVDSPSVLLYGDSYAGFLYYYMAQNFSKGTYLWTPLFYPSIIEIEKPDIVIQEMNDYSIMNLLYPNPPLSE